MKVTTTSKKETPVSTVIELKQKLIATYGEEACKNLSPLKMIEALDKPSMILVRNASAKVGFGVYDVTQDSGTVSAATPRAKRAAAPAVANVVPFTKPAEAAMTNVIRESNISSLANDSIAFVPERDRTFIPFGCFDALKKIFTGGHSRNVFIYGDSGNGKTLMVEQACAITGRELVLAQINEETSMDDIFGHYQLVNGDTRYVPGKAQVAAERGAILLLDEVDRGSTKLYDLLMGLMAGRPIVVEKTGQVIKPAPGFMVIATANTSGRGDNTGRFVGAQVINEAFLERFDMFLNQDYPDAKTETKILAQYSDNIELNSKLVTFAQALRNSYKNGAIDNHITTRRLVMIVKNAAVFNANEAVGHAIRRFDDRTYASVMKTWALINPAPSAATTTEVNPADAAAV